MDSYGSLIALKTNDNCLNPIERNNLFHANIFRIISNCLSLVKNDILPYKLFYYKVHDSSEYKKILNKEDLHNLTE